MIIIADSGSSKIDWRLFQLLAPYTGAGPGFNPYYQPIEDLEKAIRENLLSLATEKVKRIYFMVPRSRQKRIRT